MFSPVSFSRFYQVVLNHFGREVTEAEYVAYILQWLDQDIARLQSRGAVESFTIFLRLKT